MKFGKFEINPAPSFLFPHNWRLTLHHSKTQSSGWDLDPQDLLDLWALIGAHTPDLQRSVNAQKKAESDKPDA